METGGRAVATADIEHHRTDAATHRDLGAHTVGPEAVDLALFQRFRRGHTKVDTGPCRPRHGCNTHVVAYQIDAGCLQKNPQPHIHPRGRPDAASLDAAGIAALRLQIRVHDEERKNTLPLRAEQLHTVPLGKAAGGVRGAADEIDLAICERRVGLSTGRSVRAAARA